MFRIEFSDERFRVVAPDGEFEDAVSYCSVSTVEYEGRVYAAYLAGDEPELAALSEHPTDTVMRTEQIKVYDISAWPTLEPVETEIEEIDFEEDSSVVEVRPIA
jgi:hypothetical protein